MLTIRLIQNSPIPCLRWFAFCLLGQLMACSQPPTEAEVIAAQLQIMAKAVSAKESKPVLRYLTEDFVGNQSLRRNQMHALMYSYFQQNKSITVTVTDRHITVQDQHAASDFKLLLTGSDQLLPERLRWLQVNLSWVKTQDGWQIDKASWQDVSSQN